MKKRFQMKTYRIKVNLRSRNNSGSLTLSGYPVIFRGFSKYRFAVHHLWEDDELWRVTELSSGIGFNHFCETRLEAIEQSYKSLIKNKAHFRKKVQEYARTQ